jgi:hypothetical protein
VISILAKVSNVVRQSGGDLGKILGGDKRC